MRIPLLSLLISLISISVHAQITFETTYGGDDNDFGISLKEDEKKVVMDCSLPSFTDTFIKGN